MKKISMFLLFLFSILCVFSSKKVMATNKKPVWIGISWERDFPNNEISEDVMAYINSVKKVGAIPILLPQVRTEKEAEKVLKTVDAIIMTGGEDIDPKYYNEKPNSKLELTKSDRDISDYLLLNAAIDNKYPVLATCRGMQFLNIVRGGTLYQDLPSQYMTDIKHRDSEKKDFVNHQCNIIDPNSRIYKMLKTNKITVNSWHHQAIQKVGSGLKVVAIAPDGIIEAIELENAPFIVGVQFHPEWHVSNNNKEFLPIFETLRDEGIKYRDNN